MLCALVDNSMSSSWTYLGHLRACLLVLLLSFSLQDDLLRLQSSNESVGLELGALLVGGHQLQGVA